MQDIFIEKIHIKKVRHLEDIEIPLSSSERKHLILTGQNGSGKTSVLEAIVESLELIQEGKLFEAHTWLENIERHQQIIKQIEKNPNPTHNQLHNLRQSKNWVDKYDKLLVKYFEKIAIDFNHIKTILEAYDQGNFILSFFDAKPLTPNQYKEVKYIGKVDLKENYKFTEKANINFLPYLVNLKARKAFANDDNDIDTIKKIDTWFDNFSSFLKKLFSDDDLELIFNREKLSFNFKQKGRETFDFNSLSDGYSAVLKIITELIFRMEKNKAKIYDVQGIVLIDELETHLHVELQKKILPLLTQFFPKVQFIVTTHSPFILNSIENAIVYDLENRILVEDMTRYSYDGIVESYFNLDKYSNSIKQKIATYERLITKAILTEEEEEEMIGLRYYLKEVPAALAPELKSHFLSVERNRKLRKAS